MLTLHPGNEGNEGKQGNETSPRRPAPRASEITPETRWFDLLDADQKEMAVVEKATGVKIPTKAALSEIESSSRFALRDGALYLSVPVVTRGKGEALEVSPVGFVISDKYLVTVRFTESTLFSEFAEQLSGDDVQSGAAIFVRLFEAIVDRLADLLEHHGAELDALSAKAFHADDTGRHRPAKADAALRATLRSVGSVGQHLGKIRDTLLTLGRVLQFACDMPDKHVLADLHGRLVTLQRDVSSLNDYDVQLSNKTQFLLDATLGFINIAQNNTIRVLTVVSIVGIPPTLVSSIYGMNFKYMPELEWPWGYPFALLLLVLSAVIPLFIFKSRGWL